jgi:hypothetical protein
MLVRFCNSGLERLLLQYSTHQESRLFERLEPMRRIVNLCSLHVCAKVPSNDPQFCNQRSTSQDVPGPAFRLLADSPLISRKTN